MKYYDMVFAGASLSACAAACYLQRTGKKVLILEKGILTAPEFSAAFQAANQTSIPAEPETAAFCARLSQRNILKPNALLCPAVHPAVCSLLRENAVDCLFRGRILKADTSKNRIRIWILAMGSTIELETAGLCDATPDSTVVGRLKNTTELPRKKTAGFSVTHNREVTYHHVPVPTQLREQDILSWLHEYRAADTGNENGKISYAAGRFADTPDRIRPTGIPGCSVMPAAYTLQQAYDTGIAYAKSKEAAS